MWYQTQRTPFFTSFAARFLYTVSRCIASEISHKEGIKFD
jgi:hypothetical protein